MHHKHDYYQHGMIIKMGLDVVI